MGHIHYRAAGACEGKSIMLFHINQQSSALMLELMAVLGPGGLRVVARDYPSDGMSGRDRWQALDALRRYDLAAGLKRIRCPVLLLMGEHFYFGRYTADLVAHVRDIRPTVIPGARFCMSWERAEEVGQETRAFLRADGGRPTHRGA